MTIVGVNVVGTVPPNGPIRLWDCQVEWARLQPSPNIWNWDLLDSLIAAAGNRQIMLVIGHPPEWAAKGGSNGNQAPWMPPGSNKPPKDDQVWSNYVVAVSTRYKGKINQYQVWNEPADTQFYSGTYSDLANCVRRARSLIKRTDPNAKVVSPPFQPRKQSGWETRGKKLIMALSDQGWPFDIYAGHIYPQVGEGIAGWNRDAKSMFEGLRKAGAPKKPMWITETNFNLGGPGNPYPNTKQTALKDAVIASSNRLDISRVYWYAYQYSNPSLIAVTNM